MSAHYEIVDGLRLPAQLGGHPALDFCNTLAGWDGQQPWDYLQSYEHLAVWAGFAGLLPADRVQALRRQASGRRTEATATLDQARAFRARLYSVLVGGPRAPASEGVAEEIDVAATRRRLRRAGDSFSWEIDPVAGLAAPIDAVAWSAGELLTAPERSLVRACPGHGCGWLFLDLRGRRRWCTMATCGNRAKVKRFAARQRTASQQ